MAIALLAGLGLISLMVEDHTAGQRWAALVDEHELRLLTDALDARPGRAWSTQDAERLRQVISDVAGRNPVSVEGD